MKQNSLLLTVLTLTGGSSQIYYIGTIKMAEGREFSKFLRSLEQFIQTVKGQNNFW